MISICRVVLKCPRIDTSNGICHVLNRDVHYRVPMSVYCHPIRLAGLVHMAPILQEEHRRSQRRSSLWRQERDFRFCDMVPPFNSVSVDELFLFTVVLMRGYTSTVVRSHG